MPSPGSEPRPRARSWAIFVKLAVSAGLLLYLSLRVDFRRIASFAVRVDGRWLAAAVALYLAGQALSAVKWRRLARAVGFAGGIGRFVTFYFIGMFFNAFGFGTVGGDVIRALYLAGPTRRRTLALNSVLADRVSGLVVLLGVALAAMLVFREYELPAAVYWSTIALSSALLGGWSLLPIVLPLVFRADSRPRRIVERDLAPYWADYRLLGEISLLALVFHLSQIAVLILLAHALELPVPWSYCFVFGPLVNIMSAIPVSLNGLGVREGGYVFFLAEIGVPRESAVAFALTWFAVVMVSGAVGGLVYLGHRADRRETAAAGTHR